MNGVWMGDTESRGGGTRTNPFRSLFSLALTGRYLYRKDSKKAAAKYAFSVIRYQSKHINSSINQKTCLTPKYSIFYQVLQLTIRKSDL